MRVFTLLFGAAYCVAFYMELALFRFYPETGRFHLAVHQDEGPAILWSQDTTLVVNPGQRLTCVPYKNLELVWKSGDSNG